MLYNRHLCHNPGYALRSFGGHTSGHTVSGMLCLRISGRPYRIVLSVVLAGPRIGVKLVANFVGVLNSVCVFWGGRGDTQVATPCRAGCSSEFRIGKNTIISGHLSGPQIEGKLIFPLSVVESLNRFRVCWYSSCHALSGRVFL